MRTHWPQCDVDFLLAERDKGRPLSKALLDLNASRQARHIPAVDYKCAKDKVRYARKATKRSAVDRSDLARVAARARWGAERPARPFQKAAAKFLRWRRNRWSALERGRGPMSRQILLSSRYREDSVESSLVTLESLGIAKRLM